MKRVIVLASAFLLTSCDQYPGSSSPPPPKFDLTISRETIQYRGEPLSYEAMSLLVNLDREHSFNELCAKLQVAPKDSVKVKIVKMPDDWQSNEYWRGYNDGREVRSRFFSAEDSTSMFDYLKKINKKKTK